MSRVQIPTEIQTTNELLATKRASLYQALLKALVEGKTWEATSLVEAAQRYADDPQLIERELAALGIHGIVDQPVAKNTL